MDLKGEERKLTEDALTSVVLSPEWRKLLEKKKNEAVLTDRMDQHASGIQYNSFQKVLKWGQPSDLILKVILNCVILSKVDLKLKWIIMCQCV